MEPVCVFAMRSFPKESYKTLTEAEVTPFAKGCRKIVALVSRRYSAILSSL